MQTEVSNPPEYASTTFSLTILRVSDVTLHLYFLVYNDRVDS